jgi:hypothetical protein
VCVLVSCNSVIYFPSKNELNFFEWAVKDHLSSQMNDDSLFGFKTGFGKVGRLAYLVPAFTLTPSVKSKEIKIDFIETFKSFKLCNFGKNLLLKTSTSLCR